MDIPFTGTSIFQIFNSCSNCAGLGSGITIYGLQTPFGFTNFTISLDGNVLPSQVVLLGPQAAGSPTTYNVTLYDNQSLPLAYHDLAITSTAEFIFDYAYVNQTDPTPKTLPSSSAPVPSSSATSPTTSPTPHPSR